MVVAASHGGVYTAYVAARAGVSGVILNDAGVGKDEAGIGGLAYLAELDVPAAAVGHDTARIGDGADCAGRGLVRHANAQAVALGVDVGMPAREATSLLSAAERKPAPQPPEQRESRSSLSLDGAVRPVHLVDSASLVKPTDRGAVVVTGSHGGVLGGRPETALKIDAFAALFNDAGVGIDGAGITRLPALGARGIAAAVVDAWSACIGDGNATYATGVLSHVNEAARRLGGRPGMTARDFVALAAHAS